MIPKTLDRLKEVRQKTLELIEGCAQEAFDQGPRQRPCLLGEAGAWTAGEIVDHIVKVMDSLAGEIAVMIELKESGQKPEVSRGIKEYHVSPACLPRGLMPLAEPVFKLGNRFASAVLPPRVRESLIRTRIFPIRNPSQWIPEPKRLAADLRSDLATSVAQLEQLFEKHAQIDYDELALSHSVFGRYTAPQLLEVLALHEEWHHPDLERVLSKN